MRAPRTLPVRVFFMVVVAIAACGDDDANNDAGFDASADALSDVGVDAGEDAFVPDVGPGDVGPSCTDGVRNNDETDVDCGGSCADCENGQMCSDLTDCESGQCTDGVCTGSACGDGVVNGGEVCDPSDPSTPCCLEDCSAAAAMGTTCGDDPDGDGCAAAPQCSGLDASIASCVVMSEMNGTGCTDDELFCTGQETCQEGTCTSAGDPCPGADGDDNCAESCDDAGDSCTGPDLADSACDDGSFCTAVDVCDAGGMCVGSGDPCPSSQVCSLEACVAQTMFHFGDFVSNGVDQVGTYDPAADAMSVLTLDGLGGDDIQDLAFSADGSLLAVSGSDTSVSPAVINIYSGDFTGPPVTVMDDTAGGNTSSVEFRRLSFSPDGLLLAFVADLELNGANGLYVVPTAGGTATMLSPALPSSSQDVSLYAWNGNTHIAFIGDVVADRENNAYVVDVTAMSPVAVPLVPEASTTATQGVSPVNLATDTEGRVYFTSDHAVDGVFVLYRANQDGTGLEEVPGTQLLQTGGADASVGPVSLSPDGTQIAFGANSPNAEIYEMYVIDLTPGASAVLISNVPTTPGSVRGPNFFAPPVWSPDGTLLAVVADWGMDNVDNDFSAFLLPTVAPAGGVRLVAPAAADNNQDVSQVGFSSDGGYFFVRGDLVSNNNTELFSTGDFTTPDQDPSVLRVVTVPAGGDVFGFSPRP